MHPKRRRQLTLIICCLMGIGTALGFILFALKQNINLFYTPTQIAKHEVKSSARLIRVGGLVKKNSLHNAAQGLTVNFTLTDTANDLIIHYTGILPDLFREGQGVVTKGRLNKNGEFQATEVLAKHDANYMPPEVADAVKRAQLKAKFKQRTQS